MAERRMFTKKITDDDHFISLSSSAQALYLHLSMSADDDGFSNQVALSMFRAHASVGDLEALLEKRYIYQFDNGVIVIKHWRMANALRKDRYTPTNFQEELAKLELKENGTYTKKEDWLPDGCQMVAERLPQDSTGKVSIGKVSEGKDSIDKVSTRDKREYINYISMDNNFLLLPEKLQEAVKLWFDYKHEKKQDYKKVGAQSLITQIYNSYVRYGEDPVIEVISSSMASNYQGITFDKLKQLKPIEGRLDWINGSVRV